MLVDYFKQARKYLKDYPFRAGEYRLVGVPTTFLKEGDAFEMKANGELFRVLTPKGAADADAISSLLAKWKRIAVQQLSDAHTGVFVANSHRGDVVQYEDYMLQLVADLLDSGAAEAVKAAASHMEELFGDPIAIRVFKYKKTLFLYEVAPYYVYEETPGISLQDYQTLLEQGKLTVVDFLKKLYHYIDFMGQPEYPRELVVKTLDWLVKETGNGCYVGQIEGTNMEATTPCSGLEPNGRLYRIAGMKDVPSGEPRTNNVAVLMDASLVNSAKLPAVFAALMREVGTWKNVLLSVMVYLDGVSHAAEFAQIGQKIKSKVPIGICVSTWGQVLRGHAGTDLGKVSHGFLVDMDALSRDGIFSNRYQELSVPTVWDDHLWGVVHSAFPQKGIVYSREYALEELARFGRGSDFFFTTGTEFFRGVMALATSKVC